MTPEQMKNQADTWWRRLEQDRALSGKETAQLQYFLSQVSMAMREKK